jgi:hypothetical protein
MSIIAVDNDTIGRYFFSIAIGIGDSFIEYRYRSLTTLQHGHPSSPCRSVGAAYIDVADVVNIVESD